jgi:tripartite-type tricarboxylate transporter receptor subunit TctC
MNGTMNVWLRTAAAAAAILSGIASAKAADYPAHPITLVVPYAAGGGNDVIARIVAEKMSASLGQTVVIENRGGAGGTIATRQVAKAEPDGYTLLIATSSLAINPSLYPNAGYNPRKDFAPIGLIASSSNVVLVNPSVPVHSIVELIALAKQQDGKLTFASTGTGSSVHLAAELFAGMAGVKLNHVPYKGSGPALNDLLGSHVALMFSTMASAAGLVRDGGKVRALAVTGATRSALFPDLPTIAEAGVPGYEAVLHYGIVAPAGTPRLVVEKLNAALNAALADDEVKKRLAVEGAEALPSSSDEYAADIAGEETKWSEIIRKAGVKGE